VIVVEIVGIEWRSGPKMNEREELDDVLGAVLWELVSTGAIECGLNDEGEVVYWMTEEQKARYFEEHGDE